MGLERIGVVREAWRRPELVVSAVLLVGALAYSGVQAAAYGRLGRVEWLLQWRILPLLAWAAAAPWLVREGARWAGPSSEPRRPLAWLLAFPALHLAVNALIRLPDAPTRGLDWLLSDGAAGALEQGPASLLLFLLLLASGRLLRSGDPAPGAREPVALPGGDRVHRVPLDRIRWIEAEGDYVRVHTTEGSHLARITMRGLERRLADPSRFLRIHRSTIVALPFVRQVRPARHGDYLVTLDDGTRLRLPRTRRGALHRLRGDSGPSAG